MNTRRRISQRTSTLTATRGRIIDIAQRLGERYAEAVRLRGQGKGLQTVARQLHTSPTTASRLLTEVKMHLRHSDETGKLPDLRPPSPDSKKRAAELVEQHFPELTGEKARRYRTVAARALENKLPTNIHLIGTMRNLISRIPHAFPEEIRKTARKSPKIREELEEIHDKLEIAAARGDPTAKTLLKPGGYIPAVYFYKLETGGGIASRHPDLFLNTRFKPNRIKGVARESLATKKAVIRQLAQRGVHCAGIMLKFVQGRSAGEIAREFQISEKEVKMQLNFGAHLVFGIPLRRQHRVHLWEKLRKQHADVLGGLAK